MIDAAPPSELRVASAVQAALLDADSFGAAADGALRALGEGQGWDLAILWFVARGALEVRGSWVSGRQAARGFDPAAWIATAAVAPDACVPGSVRRSGRGCWIADVRHDPHFSRGQAAVAAGVDMGCWLPLDGDAGVVGVVEFLGCLPAAGADEFFHTFALLGSRIGRHLERRLAAERSLAGCERIRALVEGIRDHAIIMLGTDGRVTSWNSGAERIYGHGAATAIGAHISLFYRGEDSAAGRSLSELWQGPADGRFEAQGWHLRKGGQRFWANIVITPLVDAAALRIGFAMVTSDLTERRRLEEDLIQVNGRLRALASRANSATEEEKGRLSREIHDVLGQELTNLKMDTAWIARRVAEPATAENRAITLRLNGMSRQIDGCVHTIRRIATGLRPTLLDDLGLLAAIDWQVSEFQRHSGIPCAAALPDHDLPIAGACATELFRILQEVLTNIARHAHARKVSVTVLEEEHAVVMMVLDDGCGISAAEASDSRALGIHGMRERAALVGGAVEIRGAPGEGTRVTIRVPVTRG